MFEWASLAGAFACAAAAAALARRLGPYPAAPLAALFAFCLPVLWRGGPLGDSNVPYAALVVAAAAAGMGTPACAGLLTVAGTLRPEAWGLADHQRRARLAHGDVPSRASSRSSRRSRPPALWVTLDNAFTGDWWWSSNIVDAYNDRFHPPLLDLTDLPGRRRSSASATSRRGRSPCWRSRPSPWASRRRPYDAGVVFPVALIVALLVVVVRGQISADDVGRMLTALAVFAAAGAAVAVAEPQLGRGARLTRDRRGRGRAARGGALARGRRARRRAIRHARRARSRRSSRPRSSASRRPATSRCRASGRASSRSRGTGLARTFIPARAIERGARGTTSARSAR